MKEETKKKSWTSNIFLVIVIFALLAGIASVLGATSYLGHYFSDNRGSDTSVPIAETSVEIIIVGQNQGTINGEGRNGTILIDSLYQGIHSSYEYDTGTPSAERKHEPITIMKYLDKSSPQLYQAFCQNESLTIMINWYRKDTADSKVTWQQYYTILLQSAKIVKYSTRGYDISVDDLAAQSARIDGVVTNYVHMEQISFTYETITWTYNLGQGREQGDSWNQKIVYVDDDYTSSTVGWKINHFNSIQDGINQVAENGTVLVYSGIYYETISIPKTITLLGEHRDTTYIDGYAEGISNGRVVDILADQVTITGFTIRNSGSLGDSAAGITIHSTDNIISLNTISDNNYGIYLLASANNNTIVHNNVINNTIQVYCPAGAINIWNDSYPSGGNYWSDYIESDYYHGPGQNLAGPDGIGDTAYLILPGEYKDRYPFMVPNGWINTPPNTPRRPSGIQGGPKGALMQYTTNTTDPEGYSIYYNFSWGDGTYSGWIGPYSSDVKATSIHRWTTAGTYLITVKAKDARGSESSWSEPLQVILLDPLLMPRVGTNPIPLPG